MTRLLISSRFNLDSGGAKRCKPNSHRIEANCPQCQCEILGPPSWFARWNSEDIPIFVVKPVFFRKQYADIYVFKNGGAFHMNASPQNKHPREKNSSGRNSSRVEFFNVDSNRVQAPRLSHVAIQPKQTRPLPNPFTNCRRGPCQPSQ